MTSATSPTARPRTRIALLGHGTVNGALLRALQDRTTPVAEHVEVVGVAVREPVKHTTVPPALLCTDPVALAAREDVDVVVEALGGVHPAAAALHAALARGADVVTANKAVLAAHGPELAAVASASGASLRYEAAAAAALPVVALLRAAAVGDRVLRIEGVLSGTANHVLGQLERGVSFEDAVRDAQRRGYAEADPSRDVDGRDTADKLVLLARAAFDSDVTLQDVHVRGITCCTPIDAAAAQADGGRLKLVATATVDGELTIAPRVVPDDDPLSAPTGPGNAVRVVLEHGGELVLSGAGAGGGATASALLRDLGEVVTGRRSVAAQVRRVPSAA